MRDNDPWFVAVDVCKCLDLDQVTRAIAVLDDDEKQLLTGDQCSEMQSSCNLNNSKVAPDAGLPDLSTLATSPRGFYVISESGLYNLVIRSRKPEAKAFKRWVTHDVLPSIRKTGTYGMPNFNDPVAAARAWADAEEAKRKAQAALQAEHSAHLDTQYDLSVTKHNLIELSDRHTKLEQDTANDMRSAYDMQADLCKYFDVYKKHGSYNFWWYMSGFMRTYCSGGIRYDTRAVGGVAYALPGELTGHMYQMSRRESTTRVGTVSVFPKSAWADITVYFEHHKDSLKDLPCIGYAAR